MRARAGIERRQRSPRVVILHSRFRYGGPPKFGGVLRPGDEVLHLVSDAGTEAAGRSSERWWWRPGCPGRS